jgi:hypothetical protein
MLRDVAVFSPHLDDGVLSASVQLMRPNAELITVFSGPPPDASMLSDWDRLTRATTSMERHKQRLLEDVQARTILNCQATLLNEPESQFRTRDLDLAELSQRLKPFVTGRSEVWLPAGIGGHADHRAVRLGCLAALAGSVTKPACILYADIPYAIYYGWPSWVTGDPCPDYFDLDYRMNRDLLAEGLNPDKLDPVVVKLDREQQSLKLNAASAYESQLAALGLNPEEKYRWSLMLNYEVYWRQAVPSTA